MAHLGAGTADLAYLTVVKLRLFGRPFELQQLGRKRRLLAVAAAGGGGAAAATTATTPQRALHRLRRLHRRGLLLRRRWLLLQGLHERLLGRLVVRSVGRRVPSGCIVGRVVRPWETGREHNHSRLCGLPLSSQSRIRGGGKVVGAGKSSPYQSKKQERSCTRKRCTTGWRRRRRSAGPSSLSGMCCRRTMERSQSAPA